MRFCCACCFYDTTGCMVCSTHSSIADSCLQTFMHGALLMQHDGMQKLASRANIERSGCTALASVVQQAGASSHSRHACRK